MAGRRSNFGFYGKFAYCVPGAPGVVILLLCFLLGFALASGVTLIFMAVDNSEEMIAASMVVSYPVMFLPAMLWAASNSRNRSLTCGGVEVDSSNFAPVGGLKLSLCVVLMAVCAGYVCDAVSTFCLPEMPEHLKKAMESLTGGNVLLNLLSVSVFAPFFEEWMCRGMILRGLLSRGMKPWVAVVLSAAVFALLHMNAWQALPAFLIGLLMGYVYLRTGSLKLTMLLHCVNNTVAVAVGHIPGFEDAQSWADVIPAPWFFLVLACAVLLLALCIGVFRRVEVPEGGPMKKVKPMFTE